MASTPLKTPTYDERKLLKRLKLSLWFMTILFVIHGLPARFPELYPITRWAMFSEADRGPKELREGFLIHYELEATDAQGEVYLVSQDWLFAGIPLTSAVSNMAFVTMHYASQIEEPDKQAEHAHTIFERLHILYGTQMTQVGVWRLYYGIDYDRFPHVDYTQADQRELIAVLTENGARVEVIEVAQHD